MPACSCGNIYSDPVFPGYGRRRQPQHWEDQQQVNACSFFHFYFKKFYVILSDNRGGTVREDSQKLRSFIAINLPESVKTTIAIDEFENSGVGILFYNENNDEIEFKLELKPSMAKQTNRFLKKKIYKKFADMYLEYCND